MRSSIITIPPNGYSLFAAGNPGAMLLADSGITAPSNLIAAWDDQSTNNNDANQATGSAQPTYSATGSNVSGPAVVNASGKYMLVSSSVSIHPTSAFTTFVAAQRTASSPYHCLINPAASPAWTDITCALTTLVDGTTIRASVGSYAVGSVDYVSDTSWHIYEIAYNGDGTFSFLVDGVAVGAGTGTPTGSGDLCIGGGILSTGPNVFSYGWRGKITDILWCCPTNDATLRRKVRKTLGRRNGVAIP